MHLTTHVLDTARGQGAAGMQVTLHHAGQPIAHAVLDSGGRATLLADAQVGEYAILFDAGAYFGPAHNFYGIISVNFKMADTSRNYHIPLILSPYGYSTYLGG